MRKNFVFSLILFLSVTCSYGSIRVPFDHKNISYMGRVEQVNNQYAEIYWPGTSVTINFKGTEIKAILKNGRESTYFYVIVDGNETDAKKIKADTIQSAIMLASGLQNTNHTLQLFKLTDNTTHTFFYGFELADGSVLLAANPLPSRKIEFYGICGRIC